jgi:hypothetical protein
MPPDLGDQFWSSLDAELNRLVDRLRASGHQHTLDLEFRSGRRFAEELLAGLDGFLPKFKEKGRVIISETSALTGDVLGHTEVAWVGLDSEGRKLSAAPTEDVALKRVGGTRGLDGELVISRFHRRPMSLQ